MLGLAHGIAAQLAFARGELTTAELEVGLAGKYFQPFPPFRTDIVVLASRILAAQGKAAESLQICQEMARELEALNIEPYGMLALYLELAEAQTRLGLASETRQTVERARLLLRRRLENIPESAVCTTYLRGLPENIRLPELAAQAGLSMSS